MKNKLFLIITALTMLSSCSSKEYTSRETDIIQLRQLTTNNSTDTYSRRSFFLIGGSYSSGSTNQMNITVFAEIDGYYRYIEFPIEKVKVKIDNSLTVPHLTLDYIYHREFSIIELIDDRYVRNKFLHSYIIHYPEEFLPENLIPIDITTIYNE